MRRLKLQMQQTVDGYVAGPNGELGWMQMDSGEKSPKYANDLIDSVDTLLMGRKMTEEFITYWENMVNNQPDSPWFSFAQKMVNIPKIVLSKTITSIAGKNISVENGDLVSVVNNLKNKSGKDMLVYGGANFVASLIKNNLIDEFNLIVNPIAIGNGLKIFTDTTKLKLTNSKSFGCGEVMLQYKPANG
ncbi:MAG: dihydrofolate reductase family protein [Chitinophagaceae bacterium]